MTPRRRSWRDATVWSLGVRSSRTGRAALLVGLGLLRRRLRERCAAGHVAAGGRERPEDPRPAVAGVRHRRASSCVIVFAAVGWCVLRYRDRGQPIPEQTHGRPALEIGLTILPARDPHRRGDPDRRHADGALQDERHRVLRQRHRPAVVVGGRLPDPGRLRRHRDPDRHERPDGHPDRHQGPRPGHEPRRDPQLVDPQAQRQARHGARAGCRRCASRPTTPGIYAGQCTEFCGLSHANMRMEVVALDAADFETWKANQLADYVAPEEGTLAATGEETFVAQCSRCHQVDGLEDADGNPIIAQPRALRVLRGGAEPDPPDDPQHVRRRHLGPARAGVPRPGVERPAGGVRRRCTSRASRSTA